MINENSTGGYYYMHLLTLHSSTFGGRILVADGLPWWSSCTVMYGVKAKAKGIKAKAVVHKAKAHKDKVINRDQGLRQGHDEPTLSFSMT